MTDVVLLYVTTPDKKTADLISQVLLTEGLAACSNHLPGMESHYWWQGKIETAQESVLILKTVLSHADRCRARIESLHPYHTPCVIELPVTGGSESYLAWLRGSVG